MDTALKNAFDTLRLKHGSHCAAAENIGIARDHYRRLRNGRANIPQRTAEYILLKAAEVEGECEQSFSFTPATPTSTLASIPQEVQAP